MQKRTLNNGLKVICYPIEHAMSVEIGLYIRAGARYENKENNGWRNPEQGYELDHR